MPLLKKLGRLFPMNKFLFEVVLLALIVCSCNHERQRVARPHLHNFPYLDDCPSLEEKAIDNEEKLKAEAKKLNMRYVDYLHLINNKYPLKSLTKKNETE